MNNIIFPGNQSSVLITPKKQNKVETKLPDTLVFPKNLKEVKDHTLITPSESDGLLFPGELQEEKSHTLISPISPSYSYDYLKVDNALSELNTAELKAKARENLEINWGHIEGNINQQQDLLEYLDQNSLGVKLDYIEQLPNNEQDLNNLVSTKNQQISIYEVQKDSYIDSNYTNYGKNEAFKIQSGDLLLTAQCQNTESESNEVSCITQDFNNKKVNLVFEWHEFELGVVNNEIKTTYRQLDPVWIIQEKNQGFQFKHIDTGLFLHCSSNKNSKCELNKEGSIFTIEVDSEGHCQICNSVYSLNMNRGAGIDRNIILWDKGSNNRIFIVDYDKQNIPEFYDKSYRIKFETGGALSSDGNYVQATELNSADCWELIGNVNEVVLLNKTYNKYLYKDPTDGFKLNTTPTYFKLIPSGVNQKYEIALKESLKQCLNQLKDVNGVFIKIQTKTRLDLDNILTFVPENNISKVFKVISTNKATKDSDGLMSSKDKINLDQLIDVDWIDVIN